MSRIKGSKLTEAQKEKIRQSLLGHSHSEKTREKMSKSKKGKKFTPEHKAKIGLAMKKRRHTWGDKIALSHKKLWDNRGRNSDVNGRIRASKEYSLWRESVFARDGYACVFCGIKGGWNKKAGKNIKVNADHIKPFAYFPELRFAIDNGRTLCEECHFSTDTFGYKARLKYHKNKSHDY